MPGIDRFVSNPFATVIKKKLESNDIKILEKKLFFEYGMSIKLSIEHFEKFSRVLKNISNVDPTRLKVECVNELIKFKKIDKSYSVTIIDEKLIKIILDLCGDSETRKIFTHIFNNELTIPQILAKSEIPKTSGYRKIENLIINGLILESGKVLSESKKIFKYKSLFNEIKIIIQNNEIKVQGMISDKIFEKSSCVSLNS